MESAEEWDQEVSEEDAVEVQEWAVEVREWAPAVGLVAEEELALADVA